MIIPIQPVSAYPNSGTQLDVYEGQVELNVNASFLYTVLDASGAAVSLSRRVSLTTGQYAAWGESDRYVADCIATNIGLTPVSGVL